MWMKVFRDPLQMSLADYSRELNVKHKSPALFSHKSLLIFPGAARGIITWHELWTGSFVNLKNLKEIMPH